MRISDWSSDVCSSDLLLSKSMGQETLEFRTAGYSETHGSIFERAQHTRSISTQVSARNLMNPDEIMRMGPDEQLLLIRSEEHTSELQSLMRLSYAVFCLNKKNRPTIYINRNLHTSHTKLTQ